VAPGRGAPPAPGAPSGPGGPSAPAGGAGEAPGAPWTRAGGDADAPAADVAAQGEGAGQPGATGDVPAPVAAPADGVAPQPPAAMIPAVNPPVEGFSGGLITTWLRLPAPSAVAGWHSTAARLPATGGGTAVVGLFSLLSLLAGGTLIRRTRRRNR
jgi:hypothetical protein